MSRIFIGVMAFIVWGIMAGIGYMTFQTLVTLMLGLSSGLLTQWWGGKNHE